MKKPPRIRRRRADRPRSRVLAERKIRRTDLYVGRVVYRDELELQRPGTRGECIGDVRPCPWVACRHHLFLDVDPSSGSIKFNYPDAEPWELEQTCALDVAARGGITLEEVGDILNVTRERVRQIEVKGLFVVRRSRLAAELDPAAS